MLQDMSAYGIGNTPLIELNAVHGNRLFVKLEKMNFLGSIKARSGYWMVRDLPAEAEGRTIVESTSGNLGLALGYFCRLENRTSYAWSTSRRKKGSWKNCKSITSHMRSFTDPAEQTFGAPEFNGRKS